VNPFLFKSQPPSSREDHGVLIPAGIAKKSELFAFLAESIPLPEYFGHNWDALEECLTDLDWLDLPKITLIHQDIPLENLPAEQQTYIEILAAAAMDSDQLQVIFPETCRAPIDSLLEL